jgi:NDP-sugar pyrophosphorylase family protein
MSINIVITMAGYGKRFYEAGFNVPKFQIEAHGKTLLQWSLLSLKNFLSADARLIFVCLREHRFADALRREAAKFGVKDVRIVELDAVTDGQATTAYASATQWLANAPVLIFNIDTFVHPRALSPEQIPPNCAGWIPCFEAPGSHWSFVRINEFGAAVQVAEKTRISDYASIGLYWFASPTMYTKAYETYFSKSDSLVRGERYIAPMYQQLIADGQNVRISNLAPADIHVLGTPDELQGFLSRSPQELGLLGLP